jgi:hypothetical protein
VGIVPPGSQKGPGVNASLRLALDLPKALVVQAPSCPCCGATMELVAVDVTARQAAGDRAARLLGLAVGLPQ